jgi:23S rRNA pseudouridine1911/1915/1917 synthase
MQSILTPGPEDTGLRLDAFLARELPGQSRSRLQQLLESGCVLVDGKPGRKNQKVRAGETCLVELPEPVPTDVLPEDIPLDILYEDGELLVINKPKGMVVHPAPGHASGTLVNALLQHCGDSLSGIGGELRPGIVHRLDKDTSGLMLAAKTDRAHAALSAQLQDHSLHRIYAALLIGCPREQEGVVRLTVGRHPTDRKKMAAGVPGGREAVTHYRVLERFTGYSHVECVLETGRTHQIRVHMASLGHPVAGDPLYGGKCSLPLDSQCLHAREICFRHPVTGEEMRFSCPLPEEFSAVLEKLRRT